MRNVCMRVHVRVHVRVGAKLSYFLGNVVASESLSNVKMSAFLISSEIAIRQKDGSWCTYKHW